MCQLNATFTQRPGSLRCAALAALLLTCVAILPACQAMSRAGLAANEQEKAASIKPWISRQIDGAPAMSFVLMRTGILLGNADGLNVTTDANGKPSAMPTLRGATATEISASTAAAVIRPGYWLTAAHCVDSPPMIVAYFDGKAYQHWPARVVWNGQSAGADVDLAIIHTPGFTKAVLEWPTTMMSSGEVLCCGCGVGSDAFCAGQIVGVKGGTGDTPFTTITHNAPVSMGDSGGPAISPDGKFVGINVATEARYFGEGRAESTAIFVKESFVRAIIEADTKAQQKAAP